MPEHKIAPKYIADHIRRVLKDGGSAPHAEGVQRFFKEEIKSRGWYTAELRKLAVRFRRSILNQMGQDFLVQVADELFSGEVLDERNIAVFFAADSYPLFWGPRISPVRDLAGSNHQLGGPRCAGSLSARAHDRNEATACRNCISLGQVAGPVASACGMRSIDSGCTSQDVLWGHHPTIRSSLG
jgi:hypothetical protein